MSKRDKFKEQVAIAFHFEVDENDGYVAIYRDVNATDPEGHFVSFGYRDDDGRLQEIASVGCDENGMSREDAAKHMANTITAWLSKSPAERAAERESFKRTARSFCNPHYSEEG